MNSGWRENVTDLLEACSASSLLESEDLGELGQRCSERVSEWREVVQRMSHAEPGADSDYLYRTSLETGSHVKWLLWGGFGSDLSVWCHQFKNKTDRTETYAHSLHDHRYEFVSVVLLGGYTFDNFPVVDGVARQEDGSARSYGVGDANVVRLSMAHRMTALQKDTVTVVIQGPALHQSSYVYDVAGRRAREFPDLALRMASLGEALNPRQDRQD